MHALVYGAVTDRGSVRAFNEDSILATPPVFVVADGIGGNEAGEVASAIVVEEFAALAGQPVIDPDDVGATIMAAHERIRSLHDGSPYGACTTAVGAVAITDDASPYWVVFNIGDSRIYQRAMGEDGLRQLSVDHSHVQELVEAGLITAERARTHPERNVVTRAVGSDDGCVPDFWVLPIVPGDRLLICSDGLFGDTPDDELDAITSADQPAGEIAEELLAAALRNGARDNVSAVVVDVLAPTTTAARDHPSGDPHGHGGGEPAPAADDHDAVPPGKPDGDDDGMHEPVDERPEPTVRVDRDHPPDGLDRPDRSEA